MSERPAGTPSWQWCNFRNISKHVEHCPEILKRKTKSWKRENHTCLTKRSDDLWKMPGSFHIKSYFWKMSRYVETMSRTYRKNKFPMAMVQFSQLKVGGIKVGGIKMGPYGPIWAHYYSIHFYSTHFYMATNYGIPHGNTTTLAAILSCRSWHLRIGT